MLTQLAYDMISADIDATHLQSTTSFTSYGFLFSTFYKASSMQSGSLLAQSRALSLCEMSSKSCVPSCRLHGNCKATFHHTQARFHLRILAEK